MTSSEPGWSGLGANAGARWVPPPPRSAASLTRFIPREELQGFASWQPDSFSDSGDGGADGFVPMHRPATPEPVDRPKARGGAAQGLNPGAAVHGIPPHGAAGDDAARTAAMTAAQASAQAADAAQAQDRQQAELQQARQAGYQDGYRDGLVALESFKESFAQQMTAQIGQLLQSFDQELGQLEQRMASRVAEVATELARQVVRGELQQRPALVAEVAQQAIHALVASARHLSVQLHPEDLPLVRSGCADLLDARGARLIAQADIERGGCVIEADLGQVDARMATRWAQAARALGSSLPWQDPAAATDSDTNSAASGQAEAQAPSVAEPPEPT